MSMFFRERPTPKKSYLWMDAFSLRATFSWRAALGWRATFSSGEVALSWRGCFQPKRIIMGPTWTSQTVNLDPKHQNTAPKSTFPGSKCCCPGSAE